MDILSRARHLESEGHSIIHLEVGEPDFATAEPIIEAGIRSLRDHHTHYTPACGLPELRSKISGYYAERFDCSIDPRRIIITPGSSGAIQLVFAAIADVGENLIVSDPGYPCNNNIAETLGIETKRVTVTPDTNFQINRELVEEYWDEKTRGVMVASPSNPTGTVMDSDVLSEIIKFIDQASGYLVVDEIYQGLSYESIDMTALSHSDDAIIINSFSKYFGMTGWRVGWVVVPEQLVDPIDRLAQNLFLAAPTMSQYAAMEAFSPEVSSILEERREIFRERRDYLVNTLPGIGFEIEAFPSGAFYIYADCSKHSEDAALWCRDLLEETGVALTPGIDFGLNKANNHVRFAYTRPIDELEEAVKRIINYINN